MNEIIQGSPEWFAVRLGRVTASRVVDITAKTKTGWGASRANYAAQLVAERLTGVPAETFCNSAMAWGTEKEPEARRAYSFHADVDVEQVGFVEHPAIEWSGCSPDGLVGEDGLVEIKAPNTSTHIATLLSRSVPTKYLPQIMWQMSCTGRAWCDFVSFDPRLPEAMRLFVQRVPRDDAYIAELEAHVIDFLGEIDETVAKLTALYQPEALAA